MGIFTLAMLVIGLASIVEANVGFGNCGPLKGCTTEGFELEPHRLEGPWYIARRDWMESLIASNMLCSARNYSRKYDDLYDIRETGHFLTLGGGDEIVDVSSLYEEIVFSDYETFAVVNECTDLIPGTLHFQSTRLLTRKPEADSDLVKRAADIVLEACEYNANLLWAMQFNFGCNFEEVPDVPDVLPEDLNDPKEPEDGEDNSTAPSRMNPVVVADAGFNIRTSWQAPASDGGKPVTSYIVKFRSNLGTFHALPQCDGASDQVVSDNFCDVLSNVFVQSPLNLSPGDDLVAVIQAVNSVGPSFPSIENEEGAKVPGLTPGRVSNLKAAASSSYIQFQWEAPLQFGSSAVDEYQITSPTCGSSGSLSASTFTHQFSGLTADEICEYTISAYNSNGQGIVHTVQVRVNADPGNISPVTLEKVDEDVVVTWPEPCGLNLVTGFSVFFKSVDDTWHQIQECTDDLNGVSLTCTLPLAILKAAPYNLEDADLIVVRTMAHTGSGSYISSPANTAGATVGDPSTPARALQIPPARTLNIKTFNFRASTMRLTCDQVQEDPVGIPVTQYALYRQQTPRAYWVRQPWEDSMQIQISSSNVFTISGLSRNINYHFACQPINQYGRGKIGNEVQVWHYGTMSSPRNFRATSFTARSVNFSWIDPETTAGYTIRRIRVEIYTVPTGTYQSRAMVAQQTRTGSSAASGDRSHAFTNLQPNTEYKVRLEYYNGCTYADAFFVFRTLAS